MHFVSVNLVILGLDVFDEINDTVGVTVFVVVPGDKLDESVGQWDTGGSIEHR